MAVEFNKAEYGTKKQILAIPDHYVAYSETFAKDHALSATINGRKIVRAGTIFPSNDANAVGIVLNDLDVTNGDQTGAIVVHGFIATAKLPALPSANAKTALKAIEFYPKSAVTVTVTSLGDKVAAGAAIATEVTAMLTISGSRFREDATTLANWTFVGETTTKLAVTKIELAEDGFTAIFTLKASAETVAGTITAIPSAAATAIGVAPSEAVNLLVVAAASA